jgi:hypothetical protein
LGRTPRWPHRTRRRWGSDRPRPAPLTGLGAAGAGRGPRRRAGERDLVARIAAGAGRATRTSCCYGQSQVEVKRQFTRVSRHSEPSLALGHGPAPYMLAPLFPCSVKVRPSCRTAYSSLRFLSEGAVAAQHCPSFDLIAAALLDVYPPGDGDAKHKQTTSLASLFPARIFFSSPVLASIPADRVVRPWYFCDLNPFRARSGSYSRWNKRSKAWHLRSLYFGTLARVPPALCDG